MRPLLLSALLLVPACAFRRQPPPGASGAVIYELQNCANCHGDQREGTRRGPPLAGLAAHWTGPELAEFFLDPRAQVERDARLRAYDAEYGSSDMSSYANLDRSQRTTLALWLLEVADPR
jgi:mono/diheme cytochrome c family protein